MDEEISMQKKNSKRSGIGLVFGAIIINFAFFAQAETVPSSSSQTKALEHELQTLLEHRADTSSDPRILVRLADLYLDIGDEVYTDGTKRRAAYEEGARLARRAIDLEEDNAQAHYLYAANLGSAAQLKGVMASAIIVNVLKTHVRRALELNPNHASALHMMGMMLEELPWILGGNPDDALTYLSQAVAADPRDTHARLDLGKVYLRRHQTDAARQEFNVILSQESSHEQSASEQRYCQEARKLLGSLGPRQITKGSAPVIR